MPISSFKYDKFASSSLSAILSSKIPFLIEVKYFKDLDGDENFVISKSKAGKYPSFNKFYFNVLNTDELEQSIRNARYDFLNYIDGSIKPNSLQLSIILQSKWLFECHLCNSAYDIPAKRIRISIDKLSKSRSKNYNPLPKLMEMKF